MNSVRQRGAVLIMVLWTAVVLTVLVTVLASSIRLSANTARYHREGAQNFASIMDAMNKAEMELMMERMPQPPAVMQQQQPISEYRLPEYRFNGQPLNLHYTTEDNMLVRIYEHAGKINLSRIQRDRLQELIQHWLGENHDPRQVQELLAAWTDWTDLNDLTTPPMGAESDYYLSLDPPYQARNNPEFDSVEEIRLIRGFDELLKDVNLEAAFTVYGNARSVNPNFATREALLLLPGMDAELVEKIIALREKEDIRSMSQIRDIIPIENQGRLARWLGFNDTGFYSVYAYQEESADTVTHAYMQIMQVRSYQTRARVYQVNPYARLPDTAPARVELPR
jgi:general secretion pathway protein K